MEAKKKNPKRWYMVMFLCLLISYMIFIGAPQRGFPPETAYAVAIMVGLWAPIIGIFGLRAELLEQLKK